MRIRIKVVLKFILVFLILSCCILLFNFADIKNYAFKKDLQINNRGRKVASISEEELESAWLLKPLNALSNASKDIQDATKIVLLCEGVPCQVTSSVPVKYLKNDPISIDTNGPPRKLVKLTCDPSKESCKNQKRTTKVESNTLSRDWSASPDLSMKLQNRKKHVQEVCQKYGLDKSTPYYQPNAWEFLINKEHGLVWCSIFKAASTTWFYNFNILAGYLDSFLLNSKVPPVALARKKYPRPSVAELEKAINSEPRPLTFMIARHPFERLVSAYRDKFLSGEKFYRKLGHKIMSAYPDLGPENQIQYFTSGLQDKKLSRQYKSKKRKYVGPSFSQFVQYIIHNSEDGIKLDEHWSPMNTFCTPCLVDFDVYAKLESLSEDGNYVIFNSGIENIIKPKKLHQSKNKPTNAVAKSYLCQLNADQQEGLLKLYAMDLELFDYKYDMLFNCTDSAVH